MNRLPILRILAVLLLIGSSHETLADGTETLGPPLELTIASGSGIVASGTGLLQEEFGGLGQPGTITVDVPASASVKQVLLYWQGVSKTAVGDDTVTVDSSVVTGSKIGGFTFIAGPKTYISTYRADITLLGLVSPGANSLQVKDLDFFINNGAAVLVIFDDGVSISTIDIRDGSDFAFVNLSAPLDTHSPSDIHFRCSSLRPNGRAGVVRCRRRAESAERHRGHRRRHEQQIVQFSCRHRWCPVGYCQNFGGHPRRLIDADGSGPFGVRRVRKQAGLSHLACRRPFGAYSYASRGDGRHHAHYGYRCRLL